MNNAKTPLTTEERLTQGKATLEKKIKACTPDGTILRFCASCGSDDTTYKAMIEVETNNPVYLTDAEVVEILMKVKDGLYNPSHGYCKLDAAIVRDEMQRTYNKHKTHLKVKE